MTYKELLTEAVKKITKADLEVNVAKLLLMHYSKEHLANIYANLDKVADSKVIKEFWEGLKKYTEEEIPFQYITGSECFLGYEFIVNKHVLIPRRETEELVERIIYYVDDYLSDRPLKIVDIGTGSGCIAIALAKELDNVSVTATDISEKALKVAMLNNNNLKANVTFKLGDLYAPLIGEKFDIIVSNPPYILSHGQIGKTVKHEPKISLYGGEDGLFFYRRIINEAKKYLNSKGIIIFEHAFDMAESLKEIALKEFPKAHVRLYQDLSGYDRITLIEVGELDG